MTKMYSCCKNKDEEHKSKIHKYKVHKTKTGRKYLIAESPAYPKSSFMYIIEDHKGEKLDKSIIEDTIRSVNQDVKDLGVIEYVEMDPESLVFFMNFNIKINTNYQPEIEQLLPEIPDNDE
jgi:hypothetical protein